jgi:hypothetical protein
LSTPGVDTRFVSVSAVDSIGHDLITPSALLRASQFPLVAVAVSWTLIPVTVFSEVVLPAFTVLFATTLYV